jgi:hypothetical protein
MNVRCDVSIKTAPKFNLGATVATPGALAKLEKLNLSPADLLDRHISGDWGDLCEEDKRMNDEAVRTRKDRIFSAYIYDGVKFYVITEWDRSVTTILLPEEY